MQQVEFDALRALVRSSFIGMRMRALWTHAGQVLYRGVGAGSADKPQLRARLSYPPLERATTWGRVTRPGQRVFYASVTPDSIPFELGVQPGDHVALARWRCTPELMLMQVGFVGDVLGHLGGARQPPTWLADAREGEFSNHDRRINAFLSRHFCQRVLPGAEHLYKMSAAIADSMLENTFNFGKLPGYTGAPRISGLLYPSVALSGTADNVAILPAAVDDSLELEWVEWRQVDWVSADACRWTSRDFASSFGADGQIEWKGRPPQFVVPPGGRHVMRGSEVLGAFDAAGNPVSPS